ncbi:hypothetical protein COLO4_26791 [Corchorus olitorius]|uniref:Nudix hydrolase domain-containing protein n=1 Tax=Corchorus olitorius TaxID=93759 RepID=A0A1R3HU50_9ROSI|nr:hypothetical protein COLO4_26791 [Corchorus olitorius]
MAEPHLQEEHFDILTETGERTGVTKPRQVSEEFSYLDFSYPICKSLSGPFRGAVHRDGDYHRAVHVWIYSESTQELLLQKRADCKDSWPGLWDISSAGHISAGDSSLITAHVTNNGKFINNEYDDVYLVTTLDPIPREAFTLQDTEVSDVKYISYEEYRSRLAKEDPEYVLYEVNGHYGLLFDIIAKRSCLDENEAFLTTADSAIKLLPEASKPITGWKGLEYRVAFPMLKPPGANFYPPDMDKMVVQEIIMCCKKNGI